MTAEHATVTNGHRRPHSTPGRPAEGVGGSSLSHRSRPAGARSLRLLLVVTDGVAATAVWAPIVFTAAGTRPRTGLATTAALTALTLVLAAFGRMYHTRMCTIRSVELARLGQVALVSGAAAAVIVGLPLATVGAVAVLAALMGGRTLYREWIRCRRARGKSLRPVIVAGEGSELEALLTLLVDNPELGFRPCGVVGGTSDVPRRFDVPWMGPVERAADAAMAAGATGVILSVAEMTSREAGALLARLADAGVHVNVTTGLTGIHHRRLRAMPLAHEPFFYVENATITRPQLAVKRALDIVGASLLLLLTAPVLAIAALAVKRHDGGPALFRQVRVGQRERVFVLFKVRTMVVDAELKLDEVAPRNLRVGPLFKANDDPRITRVGRVLRESGIDELPQLWNVLRGDMSLVGPRPALPEEVADFDEELRTRHDVRPGLTGLWQVEGRDKASFSVYRHLDLFYVQNWSLGLDVAILARTAMSTVWRACVALRRAFSVSRAQPGATIATEEAPDLDLDQDPFADGDSTHPEETAWSEALSAHST